MSHTNGLLARLPSPDYDRIRLRLRHVVLERKRTLHRQGERIAQVVFPTGGACSLTLRLLDGGCAEVAVVGTEGVVGGGAFFGDPISLCDVSTQITSAAGLAMDVGAFIEEMGRYGALYDLVGRHNQALMTQAMQTTVCNGRHSVEQRCCRWLLTMRDRLESDVLQVSHEVMSQMLGVRRPSITLVVADLQRRGLVDSQRCRLRIVDAEGMKAVSCECYEAAAATFERLLCQTQPLHESPLRSGSFG